MKIMSIKDKQEFFNTIDKCKGEVILITNQGDKLNLKSKLCKYIAIASFISETEIENIELLFSEPSDALLLTKFLISE